MADDKTMEPKVAADEEPKQEEKATARKKSLGGLDSASVLSGPRQRKKADHFQVEVKEKADFVIKAGKGAKLGDIPNVHYLLGKLKTDDELLTSLHSLLYKRPGTTHRRRRNLYEFSGLTFDEGDKEKEMEKIQERLGKWTIGLLNGALDVFELPRGNGEEGKKEAKVERLLRFLEEPKKMSEKDLAAQAAKKKDAAKAKKEKEQKSKTPKSAAKGGRKSDGGQSAKKGAKKVESEEEPVEEPSEVEEEAEEEEAPEPEEQPKKRAKKESTGSAKKVAEKKTPPSRKTGRKRKADEEEIAEVVSGEGADEVPDADLPGDEAIEEATLELLKVSDVNTTTVKDLLKKLKAKFGVDLSKKKALVKALAVDYAQSKAAASEEAEDAVASDPKEEAAEDAQPPAKKQKKDETEAVKEEDASTANVMDTDKVEKATEETMSKPAAEPEAAEAVHGEPGATEPEPEAKVDEATEPEAKVDEATEPDVKAMETDQPKGADAEAGNGEPAGGVAQESKE